MDNHIEPTKSVVHLRVSASSDIRYLCKEPNVIGQNKSGFVSFLSSVLERFLIKNGFSLPKGPFIPATGSPRKRKKLERYQFDDSGYAEPASIGEMSLEDQHHMSVPDLSTTLYTTPVSFHILSLAQICGFDYSIGCSLEGDYVD
jgi:hypothetical protein